LALGRRARECADEVEHALRDQMGGDPAPAEEFFATRPAVVWFSTLLIARWLANDISPDDDELTWISHRGQLAAGDEISIVHLVRANLVWRDVTNRILVEEAQRLKTPRPVLITALESVRRSCDAGIVRTARTFAAHLRDVNARLEDERTALRHDALHDPMTGLPNRTLLYDRLEQEIRRAQRGSMCFAVLLADLDGFKAVNDSLGHRVGDLVLHEAAARLACVVRDTDTVARLGGDEFVAVLSAADHQAAAATATRMRDSLSPPLTIEEHTISLCASIGIAVYPADGQTVRDLLIAADRAMYEAKSAAARSSDHP
jgi:diguanylate cyclase (GGDEF)-like protein